MAGWRPFSPTQLPIPVLFIALLLGGGEARPPGGSDLFFAGGVENGPRLPVNPTLDWS